MKMEILLTGGSVFVPERLNAHFSTVVYLEHESRKILIDPGNLPSIDELEKRFSEIGVSPEEITDVFSLICTWITFSTPSFSRTRLSMYTKATQQRIIDPLVLFLEDFTLR